MDQVSGRGTLTLEADKLILVLEYHMGDTFTFEAVRGTVGQSSICRLPPK